MRCFSLLAILLWLFPLLCWGESTTFNSESASRFFDPSANDQSLVYLGEIFGSIPPVLGGTGTTLLSELFRIFNTAIFSVAVFFLGYTGFVGVLNTAGQGELLGKKWSSLLVSIRLVLGMSLLVPTPSGFCTCQIFFTWMIVQGVGAADHLTNEIVNYMEEDRAIFVKSNAAATSNGHNSSANTAYDSTVITSLFQGLSCMQAAQKMYPATNPNPVYPPQNSSTTLTTITYVFQGKDDSGAIIPCGTLTTTDNEEYMQYLQQAINAIMPSLNAAAYFMVDDNPTNSASFYPENDTYESDVLKATYDFVGSGFLTQIEQTYASYLQQASTPVESDDGYLENIRAYGWVSLGDLYWKMAKSSDNQDATYNYGTISWTTGNSQAPNLGGTETTMSVYIDWASDFIASLVTTRESQETGGSGFKKTTKTGSTELLTSTLIADITKAIMRDLSDGDNPLIQSQKVGHDTIVAVEVTFAALIPVLILVSAWGGSFAGCSSLFLIVQLLWMTLLPSVLVFLCFLAVLGGTLAVAIPMIPAMIYSISVIGWMVSTVETEVAAPIVAVAILHPETHEIFGKAEPAIMLILNILLRPSFLVLGLAIGSMLCFVGMQFVNFVFFNIMGVISGNTGLSAVEMIFFLMTYVGLMIAVVNKSFSIITALPDQAMRWISGGEGAGFSHHGNQDDAHHVQEQQAKAGQAHGEQGALQKQAMERGAGTKGQGIAEAFKMKREQDEQEAEEKDVATTQEGDQASNTTQTKKKQRSDFQKKHGLYNDTRKSRDNENDDDEY